MRTSLLIADHNRLLRQGLLALLKADGEFEVIAEAQDAREAIRIAITHAPDVVLIDSRLPGLFDTQVIEQIKRRLPYIRIVMLSDAPLDDRLDESPGAGAHACVRKDASFHEFRETLRSVAAGNNFSVKDRSASPAGADLGASTNINPAPLSKLTLRERSTLQSIVEGNTNRATAIQLSVSQKTVEKHRANLMRKLGVHNATELMFTAVGMGLVEPPTLGRRRAAPLHAALHSTVA